MCIYYVDQKQVIKTPALLYHWEQSHRREWFSTTLFAPTQLVFLTKASWCNCGLCSVRIPDYKVLAEYGLDRGVVCCEHLREVDFNNQSSQVGEAGVP